jgi:hypothetical protein
LHCLGMMQGLYRRRPATAECASAFPPYACL